MITTVFCAGGTGVLRVSFRDEDGTPVVPNNVKWKLLKGGAIVNNRDDVVATPAVQIDIVLSGADLIGGTQHLDVYGDYDSSLGDGLPFRRWTSFHVDLPPTGA